MGAFGVRGGWRPYRKSWGITVHQKKRQPVRESWVRELSDVLKKGTVRSAELGAKANRRDLHFWVWG